MRPLPVESMMKPRWPTSVNCSSSLVEVKSTKRVLAEPIVAELRLG